MGCPAMDRSPPLLVVEYFSTSTGFVKLAAITSFTTRSSTRGRVQPFVILAADDKRFRAPYTQLGCRGSGCLLR
jgi:hypothetical protein